MEGLTRRRNILLNSPHIKSTSGSGIIDFVTDVPAPVKGCKVHFIPEQSGSGSPAPDNVRAISGWTGLTVARHNDNLVFVDRDHTVAYQGSYSLVDGVYTSGSGAARFSVVVPVQPDTDYRVRYTRIQGGTCYVILREYSAWPTQYDGAAKIRDLRDTVKYTANSTGTYGFTTSANAKYITIEMYKSSGAAVFKFTDIAVYLGRDTRDYIAPDNQTAKVTWTEAGTVYGGYVDLVKGEVVEEWSQIASYNGETLPGEWISDRDVYTAGTSPTIGAQVAYKLATPITHQLTPQVIKTLKGINNIWSDANGNVEVKFWKH